MAGQPAHRKHKKQLERITLEELQADPGLSGMMSIFNIPATGPPVPGFETKTPIGETPMGVTPMGGTGGRIRRCALAQDAHTHSEEAVYQILWAAGRPSESPDYRLSSLSLKLLSEKSRMDLKSVQAILRRLAEKLTLELASEYDSVKQSARVWKVYSYPAILERRRATGFEWVIRNKGIHFVPAPARKQ
jgi:hypothetical protein